MRIKNKGLNTIIHGDFDLHSIQRRYIIIPANATLNLDIKNGNTAVKYICSQNIRNIEIELEAGEESQFTCARRLGLEKCTCVSYKKQEENKHDTQSETSNIDRLDKGHAEPTEFQRAASDRPSEGEREKKPRRGRRSESDTKNE